MREVYVLFRASININAVNRARQGQLFRCSKSSSYSSRIQERQWFFQVGLSNPSGPPDARVPLPLWSRYNASASR